MNPTVVTEVCFARSLVFIVWSSGFGDIPGGSDGYRIVLEGHVGRGRASEVLLDTRVSFLGCLDSLLPGLSGPNPILFCC